MTSDEYDRKRAWLLEVLKDAEARGDIYLEYDVKEKLEALHNQHHGDDE